MCIVFDSALLKMEESRFIQVGELDRNLLRFEKQTAIKYAGAKR